MSELVFYAAVCTDVGNRRRNNEDNFCLLGRCLGPEDYYGRKRLRSPVAREGVVAVFDGMGGESHGEVASLTAAECLAGCGDELLSLERAAIDAFVARANARVCKQMDERRANMGSTMALAVIADGLCVAANIGDSRVYLLRGGELTRLSRDHTVAGQLIELELLTPGEAASDKRRHQLTQHLGVREEDMSIRAEVTSVFELRENDRLLLCSDGVTDALSDSDLCALLSQETICEKMAGGIVDSAMLAGSTDNVTALVAKVGVKKQGEQTERRREKGRSALVGAVWAVSGALALVWGALAALLR